jgi:thioredoxin-like negative regulator of GroEL
MATIPKGTFPATPPSLTEAAQLMTQKKYAEALPRLNTVLAADPRNLAALRYRVAANMSLSHFAEARADVDTLLRMKPNN